MFLLGFVLMLLFLFVSLFGWLVEVFKILFSCCSFVVFFAGIMGGVGGLVGWVVVLRSSNMQSVS